MASASQYGKLGRAHKIGFGREVFRYRFSNSEDRPCQAPRLKKRAEDCRSKAQKSEDRSSKMFWLDLAKRWENSAAKESVSARSDCLST